MGTNAGVRGDKGEDCWSLAPSNEDERSSGSAGLQVPEDSSLLVPEFDSDPGPSC
jgi:hypothetical protein